MQYNENYKIHNSMIMQVREMFHYLEQLQLYSGQLSLNQSSMS